MSLSHDTINERTSLRTGESDEGPQHGIPAHLPQDGLLSRTSRGLRIIFRPFLKSSYPSPDSCNSAYQQLKYDLLLPPTGTVARVTTLFLLAVLTWAALWSVLPNEMVRKSNISGLYLLVLSGLVAGWLVERIKLAPLLGMLIVGAVFRNVYPIDFARHIDSSWSSALRYVPKRIKFN